MNRFVTLVVAILVVGCSPATGASPSAPAAARATPAGTATPATTPPAQRSPSADASGWTPDIADYSDVPGRMLVQHLGNALDGSESDSVNGHYDRRRFYLMDPAGKHITELLPGKPPTGKNMADISPDHTKVVFEDWPEGNAKIYEVGLDGTAFRTISTPCDCSEEDPAYSPDGKKIVFARVTGANRKLMIRDLATGKVTAVKGATGISRDRDADSPEHPSWSPDGKTIIYALMHRDADGELVSSQLFRADIAAGTVTKVPVPTDLRAGEPRYSPDGTLILFASDSAETSLGRAYGDVYTIRADGTGMKNLTDGSGGGPAGGTGASWTPDGKHILYMNDRIWLMAPDGANKRLWSASGPDMSTTETGFGYTTYWIPEG